MTLGNDQHAWDLSMSTPGRLQGWNVHAHGHLKKHSQTYISSVKVMAMPLVSPARLPLALLAHLCLWRWLAGQRGHSLTHVNWCFWDTCRCDKLSALIIASATRVDCAEASWYLLFKGHGNVEERAKTIERSEIVVVRTHPPPPLHASLFPKNFPWEPTF